MALVEFSPMTARIRILTRELSMLLVSFTNSDFAASSLLVAGWAVKGFCQYTVHDKSPSTSSSLSFFLARIASADPRSVNSSLWLLF